MTETTSAPWIDLSIPIKTGMVHWPGDPAPMHERITELERGDEANVTLIKMTAHTGTHMDGPCHFLPGKPGVETFPFEAGIGRARVIEVPADRDVISAEDLETQNVQEGERLIFKTRNAREEWSQQDFKENYVALNASAARYLADRKTKLVGVDYLSVGVFKGDGADTHRALLGAGVWIVEGLNLQSVSAGEYDLIVLPLHLHGSDGSPVRAIIRQAT